MDIKQNLSIFSAVCEISRTFDIFTPKAEPLPGGVGAKKCIDFIDSFSQQFITFPRPPKIPLDLSAHACQIWSRSDNRVGKTDRHTDTKGCYSFI